MSDPRLERIRELIQVDVGNRGLRTDPAANLVTACAEDLARACRAIAESPTPAVGVVTGFFIPTAQPPAGETDGPLGAVFLARALVPLGVRVVLATDDFCARALEVGLGACGLRKSVPLVTLPPPGPAGTMSVSDYQQWFAERAGPLTHLVALERVGPTHTLQSLQGQQTIPSDEICQTFQQEVPPESWDCCHTMRGRDITVCMSPAHRLFEPGQGRVTIGIGDGGNEIGMGKVPWDVIRRNIPGGGRVACRVATELLIVSGISNWGAYGLAAGVRLLRGCLPDRELFDTEREREILEAMVEAGPLVDGVTGEATATVDGVPFDRYAEPLRCMVEIQ